MQTAQLHAETSVPCDFKVMTCCQSVQACLSRMQEMGSMSPVRSEVGPSIVAS